MSSFLPSFHRAVGLLARRALPSPRKIRGEASPSWDACQGKCPVNYQSAVLCRELAADHIRTRGKETGKTPYSRLMALIGIAVGGSRSRPPRKIKVVDFGGGAGRHWWEARCTFGDIFEWIIVETPALIEAVGRAKIGQPGFAPTVREAQARLGEVDLCLASGSLQYCPEPAREIADLAALESPYCLLLRTPLLAGGQDQLSARYWIQSANVIHHLSYPVMSQSLLRRIRYPLTFLSARDLAPLDAAYDRFMEFSEGTMYELPALAQAIEGKTILWTRK